MSKDSNKLLLLVLCVGICISNAYGSSIAKNGTLQHRNDTIYEDIDLCESNPCVNGGTCSGAVFGEGYQCHCVNPFTGINCKVDLCESNPCGNGGTCRGAVNGEGYQCHCVNPFTGLNCEVDISFSTPSSTDLPEIKTTLQDCNCGNNSISCKFDTSGNPICKCNPGYAQRREKCSETCNGDSNCLNSGFCFKGLYGKFCQCQRAFTGDKCEIDLCETLRSKCYFMRATCTIVGGIGVCECPDDKRYNSLSDMCEEKCENYCVFGKCIYSSEIGSTYCRCEEDYFGTRCDQTIIVTHGYKGPTIVFIVLCIAIVAFTVATICMICHIKNLKKTNSGHFVRELKI